MHLAQLNIGKLSNFNTKLKCCAFVSVVLFSQIAIAKNAYSNSILISLFEGQWRLWGQNCSGFSKTDPSLGFNSDEGGTYASFGKLKCKVELVADEVYGIADAKKCAKSGFTSDMIGKYKLIRVENKVVPGHLYFTNENGESQLIHDCRVHK